MKTINLKYTLSEDQISTIAKGLGYSDTKTNINPETNAWESVPNDESQEDYIVRNFTAMIESRVKPFFLADIEVQAQQMREAAAAQVDEVIQASKEVIVETI